MEATTKKKIKIGKTVQFSIPHPLRYPLQILQMSRFVLAIILTLFAAVPGTLARVGISHFHAPSRELQRRHARRERSQFAGKIERSRKVRKTKKKQLAIKGPAGNEAAKIRKIVDKTPSPRYWEHEIEAPKERD